MLAQFRIGTGPVGTVLLHGFLGSGKNLRTLAQAWSDAHPSRSILLPDLTGHGQSPALAPNETLESLAQAVFQTAREVGLQGPLDIAGHSLGGRVALAALEARPKEVARVSLLDIAPGPIPDDASDSGRVLSYLLKAPATSPDRRAMRNALLSQGLSEPLTDWLAMNLESAPEGGVRWRFDRQALAELHSRVNHENLWPIVENAQVPIRCLRGGKAPYVTDEDVLRLEAARCPVTTLPNAGHYVHVQEPQAVLRWLLGR